MLVKDGKLDHLKNGPIYWVDSADVNPCMGEVVRALCEHFTLLPSPLPFIFLPFFCLSSATRPPPFITLSPSSPVASSIQALLQQQCGLYTSKVVSSTRAFLTMESTPLN